MNRVQAYLLFGGVIGALLMVLGALVVPLPAVAQQPRPTLTPTPEITSPPPTSPPEESPPGSQPAETAPSPQTLPYTGPSLLPVTGYGLTAIGVGFGMAAAALAVRRVRRRHRPENPEHPQKP